VFFANIPLYNSRPVLTFWGFKSWNGFIFPSLLALHQISG